MTEDAEYFVRRRGQVFGPWTFGKLSTEVQRRKLGRHDEISEDQLTWIRAKDVDGLFPQSITQRGQAIEMAETKGTAENDTDASKWWYEIAGARFGPVKKQELKRMLRYLDVQELTVWQEGMPDWQSPANVEELHAYCLVPTDRHGVDWETQLLQQDLAMKCSLGFAPVAAFVGALLYSIGVPTLLIALYWIVIALLAVVQVIAGWIVCSRSESAELKDVDWWCAIACIVVGVITTIGGFCCAVLVLM